MLVYVAIEGYLSRQLSVMNRCGFRIRQAHCRGTLTAELQTDT